MNDEESHKQTHKQANERNDVYSYDFKLIKINCVAKGRTYFENNKKSAKKPNQTNKPYIQQPKKAKQIRMHRNESAASVYGTFASK